MMFDSDPNCGNDLVQVVTNIAVRVLMFLLTIMLQDCKDLNLMYVYNRQLMTMTL